MNKVAKRSVIAVLSVFILFAIWITIKSDFSEPATLGSTEEKVTFREGKLGLEFTFSRPLVEQTLSERDIRDQFIGRLSADDPAMLVSIRYEDGLASVATLTNSDPLSLVADNAVRALPSRYQGFTQKSVESISVGGQEARQVVFEYIGENDTLVAQDLTFIDIGNGTVVYVASQTASESFEQAKSYFDEIKQTLFFNQQT